MELALRPSIPAPREQRQPRREQRAEATDSEAHGIPAGPVPRLRSGLTQRAVRLRALKRPPADSTPPVTTTTPNAIGSSTAARGSSVTLREMSRDGSHCCIAPGAGASARCLRRLLRTTSRSDGTARADDHLRRAGAALAVICGHLECSRLVQYGWISGHSLQIHPYPDEQAWAKATLNWWVPGPGARIHGRHAAIINRSPAATAHDSALDRRARTQRREA